MKRPGVFTKFLIMVAWVCLMVMDDIHVGLDQGQAANGRKNLCHEGINGRPELWHLSAVPGNLQKFIPSLGSISHISRMIKKLMIIPKPF